MKAFTVFTLLALLSLKTHASVITRAIDFLVQQKSAGSIVNPITGKSLKAPSKAKQEENYVRFHRFVTRNIEDSDRSWSGPYLSTRTAELQTSIRRSNRIWGQAGLSMTKDHVLQFTLSSVHRLQPHELKEIESVLSQRLESVGKNLIVKVDNKTQKLSLDVSLFKLTERQLRSVAKIFSDFDESAVALGF